MRDGNLSGFALVLAVTAMSLLVASCGTRKKGPPIGVVLPVLTGGSTSATCTPSGQILKQTSGDLWETGGSNPVKKIILSVDYIYYLKADCSCQWYIGYTVEAQNRHLGVWKTTSTGELWSVVASLSYKLGGTGAAQSISYSKDLRYQDSTSDYLASGTVASAAQLPVLVSGGTVEGQRLGGSSGISVRWTVP